MQSSPAPIARKRRPAPFDQMRREAASLPTYHERLAFAVLFFAVSEAAGIRTTAYHRKRAQVWLASDYGRALCVEFDIEPSRLLERCKKRNPAD